MKPSRALSAVALILVLIGAGWLLRGAAPGAVDRPIRPFDDAVQPARIVAFGTSLTARPDWPQQLQSALADCLGHPVTVIPVAKAGANASWAVTQMDSVIALNPDVILIEFAINDADLGDGLSPWASLAAHRQILTGLTGALPQTRIVLMTTSPAHGLRGMIRPLLGRYYASYRDLAAEFDTGLADIYPRWLDLPRSARGLQRDGLHPDATIAAEMMLGVLLPLLGEAAGTQCDLSPRSH